MEYRPRWTERWMRYDGSNFDEIVNFVAGEVGTDDVRAIRADISESVTMGKWVNSFGYVLDDETFQKEYEPVV